MSRLALNKDDHPEAARKHLDDAHLLRHASRFDGAAYHAGYVVECSLKAVLLYDRSYDSASQRPDPLKLGAWHKTLRSRPYGHALGTLLAAQVGTEGARYMPPLHERSSIVDGWSETIRYWSPGAIDASTADAYLQWAEIAVASVVQMQLDGVL